MLSLISFLIFPQNPDKQISDKEDKQFQHMSGIFDVSQ